MRYIIVLALLCPFLSNCQPITINGKIINEQMEPVAGATITLKRPATGINQLSSVISQLSSDAKGEFTMTNVWLTDTLIITAIGYETAIETLDFNSRGLVTIILKRRASMLEEVVVNTGYQTIPKERATGSFETISNHLLNQQTGISIIDRLQGVSSIFFDKNPLRQPLSIRGPSSIMGSREPLVILDNFPYNGDITNINPADVESVTILKDAAAASIWGTKAGNGVIVINTKKGGVSQPLSIEWTSGGTITAKPNLFYLPSITPADFIGVESFLFSKGFRFSDTLGTTRPAFSPVYEILFKQKAGSLTAAQAAAQLDALRGWDVRNDAEKYLYRPSFHQQHAINLKGGSSAVSYYFSAGFDSKTDNLDGTYKRASLRAENNFRLSSKLRLSAYLFFTNAWSGSGKPSFERLRPNLYPYTQLAGANGDSPRSDPQPQAVLYRHGRGGAVAQLELLSPRRLPAQYYSGQYPGYPGQYRPSVQYPEVPQPRSEIPVSKTANRLQYPAG